MGSCISAIRISTVLVVFATTAGCGQGQAPVAEKYYTLTMISGVNADGTFQTKTQQISESDEIAQRDAWEAEAASRSGADVPASEILGVDGKVGPSTGKLGTIRPQEHGLTYSYYCDSSYMWA